MARKEVRMTGRWASGAAEEKVFVLVPVLCPPADPLRLTGGFFLSFLERDRGGGKRL